MCQRDANRCQIIGGPGELDVVCSLVRGYSVVFNVVVDEHDDEYGREPDYRNQSFIITGLWRLGDRDGLGFVARANTVGWSTKDLFDEYPVPEFITGEYSLRRRGGWLAPCSADAKVTVSDGGPVMFYDYTAKPGA